MGLYEQLKATPRWQVRRELVHSSTDAVALFAWLPHETEGWVRAAMAKAFGELGGPESHKALEQLVHDESGLVRREAVKALDQLQTLTARFTLRETYVQEDDPLVRRAVAESQVPIGEPTGLGKLYTTLAYEKDPLARSRAIQNAAIESGRQLLPNLYTLLQTESAPMVRQTLYDLILALGGPEALQYVIQNINRESSPQVRGSLVHLLSRHGGDSIPDVFLRCILIEQNDMVRAAHVNALGAWQSREMVQTLQAISERFAHIDSYATLMAARRIRDVQLAQLSVSELFSWLSTEPSTGLRASIVELLIKPPHATTPGLRRALVAHALHEEDDSIVGTILHFLENWYSNRTSEFQRAHFRAEIDSQIPAHLPRNSAAYDEAFAALRLTVIRHYKNMSADVAGTLLQTATHPGDRLQLFTVLRTHKPITDQTRNVLCNLILTEANHALLNTFALSIRKIKDINLAELIQQRLIEEKNPAIREELLLLEVQLHCYLRRS